MARQFRLKAGGGSKAPGAKRERGAAVVLSKKAPRSGPGKTNQAENPNPSPPRAGPSKTTQPKTTQPKDQKENAPTRQTGTDGGCRGTHSVEELSLGSSRSEEDSRPRPACAGVHACGDTVSEPGMSDATGRADREGERRVGEVVFQRGTQLKGKALPIQGGGRPSGRPLAQGRGSRRKGPTGSFMGRPKDVSLEDSDEREREEPVGTGLVVAAHTPGYGRTFPLREGRFEDSLVWPSVAPSWSVRSRAIAAIPPGRPQQDEAPCSRSSSSSPMVDCSTRSLKLPNSCARPPSNT